MQLPFLLVSVVQFRDTHVRFIVEVCKSQSPPYYLLCLTKGVACKTRYHHDYYIHSDATKRTYYGSSSPYLQISMHYFIGRDLAEMFSSMMVNAWYENLLSSS